MHPAKPPRAGEDLAAGASVDGFSICFTQSGGHLVLFLVCTRGQQLVHKHQKWLKCAFIAPTLSAPLWCICTYKRWIKICIYCVYFAFVYMVAGQVGFGGISLSNVADSGSWILSSVSPWEIVFFPNGKISSLFDGLKCVQSLNLEASNLFVFYFEFQ